MKVISAEQAAELVKSGDSLMISGSGGGHCIPELILEALERRFLEAALPRDLCLIHVVGLGNRAEKGVARFCHPGMIKRSITSALIDSPVMIPMAFEDRIESYTLPQGVLSQITRDIAGGRKRRRPPVKAGGRFPSTPAAARPPLRMSGRYSTSAATAASFERSLFVSSMWPATGCVFMTSATKVRPFDAESR